MRAGMVGNFLAGHAHVEKRTGAKGKAASHVVDLVRRNSEIEKDSIIADAAQNGYGVERGEIRAERPEPSR